MSFSFLLNLFFLLPFGAVSANVWLAAHSNEKTKIPAGFIGSWLLPDQPKNIIEIEERRILGGPVISEPLEAGFEGQVPRWEFFANLSVSNEFRRGRKECIKCFHLEAKHRNVIIMNAGHCILVRQENGYDTILGSHQKLGLWTVETFGTLCQCANFEKGVINNM